VPQRGLLLDLRQRVGRFALREKQMQSPPVVIDNGTGFVLRARPKRCRRRRAVADCVLREYSYTKMGYAGNCEPQYIVPTTIASRVATVRKAAWFGAFSANSWLLLAAQGGQAQVLEGLDDMDFYIGNEAHIHSSTHQVPAVAHQGRRS
jgi:actin-related protein